MKLFFSHALLALSIFATTPAAAQPSAPAPVDPADPSPPPPAPTATAPAVEPDPVDEPAIRPDPRAVAEAREANLEPESSRSGLAIGIAVGPNIQVSNLREASGTGGGLAIRFGTVASPRWVWLAELASTGYQQVDEDGTTRVNSSTLFTLGGQLYLKEAFWLRGGGGAANFTRRTQTTGQQTSSFWGLGVIGAGGLDLLRRHSFALSLEVLTTLARYRDGVVAAGTLQLGISWY